MLPKVSISLVLSQAWVFALGWVATAQAGVNVLLAADLNDASMLAAAFSVILTGIILLGWSVGAEVWDSTPVDERKRRERPAWWKFLGGTVGFLYLGSSVLLVPRMGFSLYFVLLVSGSITAGIVFDHFGTLGVPVAKIDKYKVAAVALCIAGVLLNVIAGVVRDTQSRRAHHDHRSAEIGGESIVTFTIGCLLPLQGLLNRALGASLRRPVEAATIQSFVNALCCIVGFGVSVGSGITDAQGLSGRFSTVEWWKWLGGLGGIILVYSGMTFIATVGVGPFFVLITLGQLSSSLLWDAKHVFGSDGEINWERYVGALLVMSAFILLTYSRSLAARRRATTADDAKLALLAADELQGPQRLSSRSTSTDGSLTAEMAKSRTSV